MSDTCPACGEIVSDSEKLSSIEDRLSRIEESMSRSEKVIATVAEQVMPTVQSLVESPMLKMLMPKGKR